MIKKIGKVFGILILTIFVLGLILFAYVNTPVKTPHDDFDLGVTFSWRYSEELDLDWREVYTAILDDLGVRKIRIPIYWDYIEETEGEYRFDRLDWQVAQAEQRGAQLIIAMGRKVPRWPECFAPQWIGDDTHKRQERLLLLMEKVVERYKNSPALRYWQVENEPFLAYGHCPPFDEPFFDRELALVRSLDPSREIVTTDSGELSLWIPAAKRGDVFGTTMYRNVYTDKYGYYEYPIGPRFFRMKKQIIKLFADQHNAIVIELQGEPWLEDDKIKFPVETQLANTDAQRVVENINFARQGGFSEIYIWGVEWWYWLATTKNETSLWDSARGFFATTKDL